ncbi:MAG: DUF5057 domain-containing protein [Acetivibrio ethanolgignens]
MRKQWKRWIGAGTAGLVLLTGFLTLQRYQAFARPGLMAEVAGEAIPTAAAGVGETIQKDRTKPLGSNENPFLILEILPDESFAELGYLIAGCEPVDMERLSYYQEMKTVAEATGIEIEEKEYYYFGEEKEYKDAKKVAGEANLLTPLQSPKIVNDKKEVYGYYVKGEKNTGAFALKTPVSPDNSTSSDGTAAGADAEALTTPAPEISASEATTLEAAAPATSAPETEKPVKEPVKAVITWVGEGQGDISWHTLSLDKPAVVESSEIKLDKIGDTYYTIREAGAENNKLYCFKKYSYENRSPFLTDALQLGDEARKDFRIQVKTVTPEILNADLTKNASDNLVQKADLISISPGSHVKELPFIWQELKGEQKATNPGFENHDLSWEVVLAIYERVLAVKDYAALFIDEEAFDTNKLNNRKQQISYKQLDWNGKATTYTVQETAYSNNVYKLGVMLRSMNPQLFYNLYLRGYAENGNQPLIDKKTGKLSTLQVAQGDSGYWAPKAFLPSKEDGAKAEQWTWNDSTRYNQNLSNWNNITDRCYIYDKDESCFSPAKEIKESDYNKKLCQWLKGKGNGKLEASPLKTLAYALEDKLQGRSKDSFKSAINILEIQPCNSFSLSARRFYFTIPDFTGSIYVTKQTSVEFLGKTEDLNSLYDMVYIGTNSAALKDDITADSTCVYRHTGSQVEVDESYKQSIKRLRGSFGNTDVIDTYYFSGNDITKIKKEELLAFAKAGYPILFEDSFFKNSSEEINKEKIDSASNIYALADRIATTMKESLYREGKMSEETLAKFKTALTMKHCTLVLDSDTPVRYRDRSYTTANKETPYKNLKDEDIYINGKDLKNLQMTFRFRIEDNNANSNILYGVGLYIDTNADGRHVSHEEQNVAVYEIETGKQVKNNQLKADTKYELKCTIDDYVGVLPWKLEVFRKDNREIRDTELGMSAIKIHEDKNNDKKIDKNDKTLLNVLQIVPENATVLLPTDEERKKYLGYVNINEKLQAQYRFYEKIKDLEEFDVHFTRLSVADFAREVKNDRHYIETKKYNMLILGFADMYTDISDSASLEAIEEAIEQGLSVLFTHDTTSFVNLSKDQYERSTGQKDFWGYHINKYFRDMVGMDRYGVTLQYPASGEWMSPAQVKSLGKDLPYKTGGTQKDTDVCKVVGFRDKLDAGAKPKVVNVCNGGHYVTTKTGHKWICDTSWTSGHWFHTQLREQSHVEASGGQITKWPTETEEGARTYYCSVCGYAMRTETIPRLSQKEEAPAAQGYTNILLYNYSKSTGDKITQKVTQTNTGQITEYPYKIDESFQVAPTHFQYYQLDMEADDIVVWYCLSDDKNGENPWDYSYLPNDARNNYYIYNRGNITYSGVGHNGKLTDTEVKLFVNTMIAAYNASAVRPRIQVTNEDKVSIGKAEAMYISYDYEDKGLSLDDFLQKELDISYKVIENNVLSRKNLTIQYYLLGKQVNGGYRFAKEEDVLNMNYGTVERTPLSLKTVEVGGGGTNLMVGTKAHIQGNREYSFHYSLEKLFENHSYIPLEIELTLTYGKKQDKVITVKQPVILYRRALFNLD